jgi:hypothetical protein
MSAAVAPGEVQQAGLANIDKFLTDGLPIGRWALFFLAGAIPMLPFSSLGEYGVNLLVGGNAVAAGAKAAASIGFTIAKNWLEATRPALWPVLWILKANPWYVFDILQTLSPAFVKDGYKIPFMKPSTGRAPLAAAKGEGKLTKVSLMMIIGIIGASFYALLQKLPPVVLGTAKPVLDIVSIVIGAGGALSLGGIGAMTVLPKIWGELRASGGELRKGVETAAAATPVPAPAPAQAGGGHVGSQMPPLREVASHLLGPDVAPYSSGILSGGGGAARGPKPDALFFWFTLMLVAGGGIALAASRS